MATAGPRATAEGFATVLRSLTGGKDEVPYWVAAPSLYTRPVDEIERGKLKNRQRQRQRRRGQGLEIDESEELAGLPGL